MIFDLTLKMTNFKILQLKKQTNSDMNIWYDTEYDKL